MIARTTRVNELRILLALIPLRIRKEGIKYMGEEPKSAIVSLRSDLSEGFDLPNERKSCFSRAVFILGSTK